MIIFANGELNHAAAVLDTLRPGDVLIAADGGARQCLELNLIPDTVIGDFDSLTEKEQAALKAAGSKLIRHPRDKDETDLELALRIAGWLKPDDVLVFGALGARWDMTVSNLLLLTHPDFAFTSISLLDGPQEISLLRGGQSLSLQGQSGDTLSLIPLHGDAHGISTHGLKYPLTDETLRFGATRGVSNVFLAEQSSVKLNDGLLLCVVIHRTGDW
ncbi:MAG: thiamine diphosphokinase [Chloroflexota bacterium]|nr:thiamine diphosphokinase [Chloroflexota bacterium]